MIVVNDGIELVTKSEISLGSTISVFCLKKMLNSPSNEVVAFVK